MKRLSDKRRALAADVPDDYAALVEMTDRCEWCLRHRPLQDHHVAQAFRPQTLYDIRLLLRLCEECHTNTLHQMPGEHGRAMGLALVYLAGRGMNARHLWDITGRKHFPPEELVRIWIDRLTRSRRAWT